MNSEEASSDQGSESKRQPYHVRLPGFITDEDIGLGEVIKRATSAIGISPCDGCAQRATALNRWLVISPWRRR